MREKRWYESPLADMGVTISARVRLARNFDNYPFPVKLEENLARQMINETARAAMSETVYSPNSANHNKGSDYGFRFFDITDNPAESLLPLMERHVLSSHMVTKKGVKGIILNPGEDLSVLLNEEDHARIQAIFPGDNIDGAYAAADALESLIEANGQNKYAFDQDYGFLTSCPTNVGTAMRASFMLHLPALEMTGAIDKVKSALAKFGMTMRGIHGEGSESMGSIYQLSNQITLGKPEGEIILSLKAAALKVISHENSTWDKLLADHEITIKDKLYRSYGILITCRSLGRKEGMSLLSDMRLGYNSGIYDMPRPSKTIYALMAEIQPGTLGAMAGKPLTQEEQDVYRAEYIRGELDKK